MERTVRPKAWVSILGIALLGATLAMTACGDDGDDGDDGAGGTNGGGTTSSGGTTSGGTTSAGGTAGQQLQSLRKNQAPSAK
jgi:hypothetical protein